MSGKSYGGKFNFIRYNLLNPKKDIQINRDYAEIFEPEANVRVIDKNLKSYAGKYGFIRFNLNNINKEISIVRNYGESITGEVSLGVTMYYGGTSSEAIDTICTAKYSIVRTIYAAETIGSHSIVKNYSLKSYGGKYGFIRFNLNNVYKEIPIVRNYGERVEGETGIGAIRYFDRFFNENIHGEFETKISFVVSRAYSEAINQSTAVIMRVSPNKLANETTQNQSYVSKRIHIERIAQGEITGSLYLGKIIYTKPPTANETIEQNIYISKNISFGRIATESILCIIEAGITEYYTTTINISLPPQGELRIDSNGFDMWINDKYDLNYHDGYWIKLDSDTVSLLIDNGVGGIMEGEISYTETYI